MRMPSAPKGQRGCIDTLLEAVIEAHRKQWSDSFIELAGRETCSVQPSEWAWPIEAAAFLFPGTVPSFPVFGNEYAARALDERFLVPKHKKISLGGFRR